MISVEAMGQALEYWLGFQDKIGRAFMMNEDALKYPLADYLVNIGGKEISSINLETPHPSFSNRRIDLTVSSLEKDRICNAFELKLAQRSTKHQNEKQRISNDLIRLSMVRMTSLDKCYFIIIGKYINFEESFRSLEFFSNWFSFNNKESKSFLLRLENRAEYKDLYKNFEQEYMPFSDNERKLELPETIITTCEYISVKTKYDKYFRPYLAGIWSVA